MSEPNKPTEDQVRRIVEEVRAVEAVELWPLPESREDQARRTLEMMRVIERETRQPASLEEIRFAAGSAAVRNAVRAIELLADAGPSPSPFLVEAVRLHLLAAGLFAVVAGSGAAEAIPNSEAGKRLM